ncbi:MAG: phosphatase PAP2 family protein [Tatlockia sp.]|nr:phosphatase PAP2 family protein [Tatlockia sp.]
MGATTANAQLLPDFVIKFDKVKRVTNFPEQKGSVQLVVTNQGNEEYKGTLKINLYASTDSVLNRNTNGQLVNDELLGSLDKKNVNLKPGKSKTFNLNFATPKFTSASNVAPGAYYLIGEVGSDNTIAESNQTNNQASNFISAAGSDAVIVWNATLLNAIQISESGGTPPPLAARNQAIVHAAIYDAVNAINRSHKPYKVNIDASDSRIAGASPDAAAVEAAYQTLVYLYKNQKPTFDEQRTRSLAEIPDGAAENNGVALGKYVAEQILALRMTDGADKAQIPYTLGTGMGDWRPTPPAFLPPLLPGWGRVTPFAIPSGSTFRPKGQPVFGNAEYARQLEEVRLLGALQNTTVTKITRTPEQTQIAIFWAYDRPDTFRPPGQWNEIAEKVALEQGNTLEANARLFALLNIAQADAGIAAWDAKYTYNQLRPISAIRQADSDPNQSTVGDPNWVSLLPTPPFPDYISGHSTFAGVSGKILSNFFGDNINFTVTSQELNGVTRSYNSFTQAADEDGISRIYGGVHVRSANEDGLATGRSVGDYVFNNFLQ